MQEIQSGEEVTETATIHRYPKDGFDLTDAQQRKDLFVAMFKVLKYSTSGRTSLNSLIPISKQAKV